MKWSSVNMSPYSTYIKIYVSTYQVAPTKLLILKLFTPCIYDQ